MKIFKAIVPIMLLIVLFAAGCTSKLSASTTSALNNDSDVKTENRSIAETQDSTTTTQNSLLEELGDGVVDGLHVTGMPPIEVDIDKYRLNITGEVENTLSLTFDEIKQMKSVRKYVELNCPGAFTDKGYWTGVEISDLLEKAIVKKGASKISFISIDGGYKQSLSIEKVYNEGFLIAYEFNDKEFSKLNGYPLRIVAKNEPGYVWVKWLGDIKVQ